MSEKPREGDLQVWWKPQVPCASFEVKVHTVASAKFLLKVLADYDLWQLRHKIKPDFSNAGGLSVFEDGEWVDWYDDDGNNIWEWGI